MDPRHALGHSGEFVAAEWLEDRGLRIVGHRYRTRFGEIDLIAMDGLVLVFIEVKTRTTVENFSALDAVTPAKQQRLARSAFCYIAQHRLHGRDFRFDILTVEEGIVHWIPNAFSPSGNYLW
jgi:putative endonuclease